MKLNNAFIDATLDQTMTRTGLLCFGPFNSRLSRYLLKEKVHQMIADKKRLFQRSNKEENASDEFDFKAKRFADDDSSISSISSFGQNQTQVYLDAQENMKHQQSSALDNLKLQSRVYRDEIDSLKRQIDCLRREKIQLESEPTNNFNRRRSHYM